MIDCDLLRNYQGISISTISTLNARSLNFLENGREDNLVNGAAIQVYFDSIFDCE